MSSALERFRALERASLISDAERARNARFQALNRDWAAEGGGSTRLTPGQQAALTNTRAANRAPGGVFNPIVTPVEDLGSTGPGVDDDGNGGDTGGRNDRPLPTTLPPLSPEMLAAIEKRRRASLRALQEAETIAEDRRMRAELEDVGRRLGIQEDIARQRREGFMELAGRGVARSPMYANPFRRELARVQQEQMAESQQTLASTLDQLQVALNAARQRREQELAQIAFDEVMARSNVQNLLGIS